MRASLRESDRCDRRREEELDRELESRRDAERADSQLAQVIREADETAGGESADRGPRARVPGERRQHPGGDAERREENAAARRRACFPLMAVGQLSLNHLS